MPEPEIKRCQPMRLVAIRHTGPYARIGDAFARIGEYAGRRGLFGPDTCLVGVYHDDPSTIPHEALRADAGVTVRDDFEPGPGDDVLIVEVRGGDYACAVHEGPYTDLGDTYGAIMRWIGEQQRAPAHAPSCEIYLNDPRDTAPQDLRTEVRVPLA